MNQLLEAGCTTDEVSAVTGQTPQMVAHYSARVNMDKMGASAIEKLVRAGS